MGLAPAAYVVFKHFLKQNPANPSWVDRDRFVLSGGHASSLLYALLYLFGYGLTLDDLKNFRQWGSKTPGHPEYGDTPGVETTTRPPWTGRGQCRGHGHCRTPYGGSVQQGKDQCLIDHYTYAVCGDGDLMEGVAMEAVSLAGHLGLGRLILIYDDNEITIEGKTQHHIHRKHPA